MIGGYREDPEQADLRRAGRRILIVSVAAAVAVIVGFEFFEDAVVVSLGLTKSGYIWLRNISWFVVLIATQRLFLRRTVRRFQTSSS